MDPPQLPAALRRTKTNKSNANNPNNTAVRTSSTSKSGAAKKASAWDDDDEDESAQGGTTDKPAEKRFAVHELFEHVQDDAGACGNPEMTHEERRERAYGMFETLIEKYVVRDKCVFHDSMAG